MRKFYTAVKDMVIRKVEGATMIEYGLMVALIAVVCIGTVSALGIAVDTVLFQAILGAL